MDREEPFSAADFLIRTLTESGQILTHAREGRVYSRISDVTAYCTNASRGLSAIAELNASKQLANCQLSSAC